MGGKENSGFAQFGGGGGLQSFLGRLDNKQELSRREREQGGIKNVLNGLTAERKRRPIPTIISPHRFSHFPFTPPVGVPARAARMCLQYPFLLPPPSWKREEPKGVFGIAPLSSPTFCLLYSLEFPCLGAVGQE